MATIFNDKSSKNLTFITDILNGDGKAEYAALKDEWSKRPAFQAAYWKFRKDNEMGYISVSKAIIDILAMARMYNSKDEEDYGF